LISFNILIGRSKGYKVHRGARINETSKSISLDGSLGHGLQFEQKVTRERLVWASTNHRNIHPFHGYADDSAFGLFGALISPVGPDILSLYLYLWNLNLKWSAKGDASRFLKENGARMLFAERMSLVGSHPAKQLPFLSF